jgi:uncharacterized iron-regulated protein
VSEIDTIIAVEQLGTQAKSFLESDLGKYLDGSSIQDIEAAKDDLLNLDPYQSTDLKDLQNKISSIQKRAQVAQAIRGYLAEAITNGAQATHQLEEEPE